MMCRKIISILFAFSLISTNVFGHTAVLENSGESKYKAFRITPEICNNAVSGLSDLRIKDSKGEDVPYFINTNFETNYEETQKYDMVLINSFLKDKDFYFDYKLAESADRDILATSVEFTTGNTNFAKNVEVLGSYDNTYWELVQNDNLYNVDDKSKTEIVFNKAEKYTYYRFKLNNNQEMIYFDTATLKYNKLTTEKSYFEEILTPKFTMEEKDKYTYVNLEGLKNLVLTEITINTDSMFQRVVEVEGFGSQELYNLSFNDASYNNTTFYLDGYLNTNDKFTLKINNMDDKPIKIDGVNIKYYAADVIFEAKEREQYTIYFSGDSSASSPKYDIEKYKDEILKENIDRIEVKEVKLEKDPIPVEEPKDYKMIFNGVVISVAVLLGILILLKLKKK